jgi:hypothetical protein
MSWMPVFAPMARTVMRAGVGDGNADPSDRLPIGYGLPHPDLVPHVPDGRCCFWVGWGGAIVVMISLGE